MNKSAAPCERHGRLERAVEVHLALLERQFIDGGTFLTSSAFDIAYATFYALVRYTRCGKGKTAALLQDFPAVEAWVNRIRAVGHGERRDIIRAEAIEIARLGTDRRHSRAVTPAARAEAE
jgi:glutathione S-transferase